MGGRFARAVGGRGRPANLVIPRCALHSGLRQSGRPLRGGCFLARMNAGPSGMWLGLAVEVGRASDPTSQMRDVGHPATIRICYFHFRGNREGREKHFSNTKLNISALQSQGWYSHRSLKSPRPMQKTWSPPKIQTLPEVSAQPTALSRQPGTLPGAGVP